MISGQELLGAGQSLNSGRSVDGEGARNTGLFFEIL